MGFTDAIKTCFGKYVTFSGRASRPEYWWFVLFVVLGSLATGILDSIVFGTGEVTVTDDSFSADSGDGPISTLFALATFLPGLAAAWRRMHDTGRSGLYVIYPLIATVGVMTFMGFVAGFDTVASGDFAGLFGGAVGIVMILAFVVLAISPLLVIWWLTRPTQPETNQWGPPPADSPHGGAA